ncbi:MAG: PEP-CTERM sorting domain-containing protein [Acidobacteriaceae bacterium]|nr:PEP-CTERM sorting domain-containing protein [Acidobacteriaceae bacterium]
MPTAFSSSGAVGFTTTPDGGIQPATFSGGVVTTLGGVGEASGINASGTIIGTTYAAGQPNVTEWSHGTATNLGINGFGLAINDAGQIAGAHQLTNGQQHAFVMTNGVLTDLGAFSGGWSAAMGINASGQVAGYSLLSNQFSHAFLWNGSNMRDLGTLGGANSYAQSLNNTGEVVGTAQTSHGSLNAVSWTSTGILDLGTLGGSLSGAYGVNDSGEIVGYSFTSGNSDVHGFLDVKGVMLDLNALLPPLSGWDITEAFAIDNSGDILAIGDHAGQAYAVELEPSVVSAVVPVATPEPATLLIVGLGLVLVARLGRVRRRAEV